MFCPPTKTPGLFLMFFVFFTVDYALKKFGDNAHSCLAPLEILIQFPTVPSVLTADV